MRHPLQAVERPGRAFAWLLVGTVIMLAVFQLLGPTDPGIVDLELARTGARTETIIAAWSAPQQLTVAFGLGLDYLFMPVYSTAIALACVWGAARARGPRTRAVALLAAWGAWVAAGFDAVENIALLRNLLGPVTDGAALVGSVCAAAKFVLIVIGIVAAVVVAIASRPK